MPPPGTCCSSWGIDTTVLGRLIVLIALIAVLVSIISTLRKTPKAQRKALYWKVGLGVAAVALLLMVVTGRVHWLGAIFAAILPFIRQLVPLAIRFFPLLQQLYRRRQAQAGPASGNQSDVKTRVLHMVLDHDSNQLGGRVLEGPFAGAELDTLVLSQLQVVLEYCQQQDKDAERLLLSYLNHRFGQDWQQQHRPRSESGMTRQEALAILGLPADAGRDAIIAAHRKLMQKVHPDRGGNDYLAAKINQAKDLLIG